MLARPLPVQWLMVVLAMSLLVLQGCCGSEDPPQQVDSAPVLTAPSGPETPPETEQQNPTQFAVTVTAAADFGSGAHSVINVEPPRLVRNNQVPTVSDLSAACHGRSFYRIERFMRDNVTKFDVDQPQQVIYQYSINDA